MEVCKREKAEWGLSTNCWLATSIIMTVDVTLTMVIIVTALCMERSLKYAWLIPLRHQHGLLLLAQTIKVTIVSPCFGDQGPLQASSCHPHMPLYSRGRRCLPTVKMRQLVKLSFWKITYCSPLIDSFPLSTVKVFNFAYSRLKYIIWLEHGDYISSHHHGNCFSSHCWDLWRV